MFNFAQARVTAHNPPFGLQVVFKSTGQMLSFPVTMLRDYADGVRVRQKPLPQIGTWGVVIFPYGDLRNGIWLGAYYPSLVDALTTTQASGQAATDPFIDYEASFSGDWWVLDGLGNYAKQWADSSWFVAASGDTLPTLYRHTVDSGNQQQTIPYPYSDRVKTPPASGQPFIFKWKHASGTSIAVDVSGNVTLDLSSTAKLNITQDGGSPTDFLTLVSKLVSVFNNHTHKNVQGGSGNSGTPTTSISASDLQSDLINILK